MRVACVKQLEIIGEAANYLSDELKHEHNEIEWRKIVGLRNTLIHEYFSIDNDIVWQIIINQLPKLKGEITKILKF